MKWCRGWFEEGLFECKLGLILHVVRSYYRLSGREMAFIKSLSEKLTLSKSVCSNFSLQPGGFRSEVATAVA